MDPSLERRTLAVEDRHWWYRGRRAIVLDAIERMAEGHARDRILDVGCGGGGMLADLARLGSVTGVEPSLQSRRRALARRVGTIVNARLGTLPFEQGSFDIALALDVIEHIEDDDRALRDLRRVVSPGGALLVTVPAYPRLWSHHDELNHHFRRYTRIGLAELAGRSGWRVRRMTHFNSLMLPAAALAHKLTRSDGLGVPPKPVNRAMEAVLHVERSLIKAGMSLPFGLSLLAELEADPTVVVADVAKPAGTAQPATPR
jgi:SAM-dependent methyltransferase